MLGFSYEGFSNHLFEIYHLYELKLYFSKFPGLETRDLGDERGFTNGILFASTHFKMGEAFVALSKAMPAVINAFDRVYFVTSSDIFATNIKSDVKDLAINTEHCELSQDMAQ